MECKNKSNNIKAIYFFNHKDCVWDGLTLVRMKRKQKGFNREIIKYL